MKNFIVLVCFLILPVTAQEKMLPAPKSDVFMQGFYWNSPPGGIWYDSLSKLAPRLGSAGFGGIWFPPPEKGAGGGFSMGYDPYDHYDFGEYPQKGSKETRFGSRTELTHALSVFHSNGIEVYADVVIRHMMGGEQKAPYECIPLNNGNAIVPDSAYLLFMYPNGSGRFRKTPAEFYPNSQSCFVDPRFVETDPLFRFGEWLDHHKQSVRDSLIEWGKYLRTVIGFDGFRLDAVKSIDPAFMAEFLKGANGNGYAVAELWSSTADIGNWLNAAKNQNGASVAMFDFPLRYTLKEMCNNTGGGFDMRTLDNAGLAGAGISGFDYSTFVENHDFDRIGYDGGIDNGHDPVLTDKQLAYAYILFSEGRPCVFFKDYFMYGYSGPIDTLIWIRQHFLYGGTTRRGGLNPYYLGGSGTQDDMAQDIYVARRDGGNGKPAAYLVINDHPTEWRGVWVNSDYPNQQFKDYTHHDAANTIKAAQADGRIDLWAPPRSYVVYIPDTTQTVNHPPLLNRIPDLTAYTNSPVNVPALSGDADNQQLTYLLSGNPAWLSVGPGGTLSGTPAFGDTGISAVTLTVSDPFFLSDADTFSVTVKINHAPLLVPAADTSAAATKRFERTVAGTDSDGDSLTFHLTQHPPWLSIGASSGIISGTPAVEDTGTTMVAVAVQDGKGGADTAAWSLYVSPANDSVIATYRKPAIDGFISFENDWEKDWIVAADNDSDSVWWDKLTGPVNNELTSLLVTWDADSVYFGVDYFLNDKNNTLMVYADAVRGRGVTNFNSALGYAGDYPKNNLFRADRGIDLFIAAYNQGSPAVFTADSTRSTDITPKTTHVRGALSGGMEAAVAWNDIYGLGNGLVEKHASLYLIALVAGGDNYGSGDAAPDNPDVNGDGGPDSLINLASVIVDANGDGIPDPTLIITNITGKDRPAAIPETFVLEQNYPNPFNPSTVISYQLPMNSYVTLKVYDVIGKEIATLVHGMQEAGKHTTSFNASHLPSGLYFYTLRANNFSAAKKMLLVK